MVNKEIKWGCIQPLTGGMYIGAEKAIGHAAKWIISFAGTTEVKTNKDGEMISVGNEYNLLEWLKKNNKMVPYYKFAHKMFEDVPLDSVKLNSDEYKIDPTMYNDMDLVVAVPVCSGLSVVTKGSQDMKDTRNCNMQWITKYTLAVIKPKIYIFENAPTLMGNRGDSVRANLEQIAEDNGYSVLYYKTDTQFHDNAQKRPRTFIIFMKWQSDSKQEPYYYNFEKAEIDIEEYLARIPENCEQTEPIQMSELNRALVDYTKVLFGEEWRQKSETLLIENFDKVREYEGFKSFVKKHDALSEPEKEKILKFIEHVEYKRSLNMNFYCNGAYLIKDGKTPSIQFKSMYSIIHPKEDRLLSIRECLHLMGMPHDFILYGGPAVNIPRIGQNVPVRTAEFIVKEAVRILANWDSGIERKSGKNAIFINNISQKIEKIETIKSNKLF